MADFNLDNLGEPTVGSNFIASDTTDYGYAPESQTSSQPPVTPMPKLYSVGELDKQEKQDTEESFDSLRERMSQPLPEAKYDANRFNFEESRAEKFMESSHYKTFGFNPNLGEQIEEKKYGNAETGWEVTKKMLGGWGSGLIHGFVDEAKSIGNFVNAFSDPTLAKSFQQEQLEEINRKQTEFDNSWHIFEGDQHTWLPSIARGVQSSGHFIGALAEIAAETLAVQFLVAYTGGAAVGAEAIEAAKWAKLLGNIDKAFEATELVAGAPEYIKNSARMADALTNQSVINKAWVNLGKFAQGASKVVPGIGNTVGYLGDLARYGAETGSIATMSKGLLAFSNDIRGINHAVSFASSNAAGTYQQLLQDQKEQYRQTHAGREADESEVEEMKDRAMRGAKVDGAINAYAMLYLEKIAFKNILNSRATLQETLDKTGSSVFADIGVKPSGIAGSAEMPFYQKQQINWGNFKSSLFQWGSEAGNYGELGKSAIQHGVSFGTTMNIMDAVDKGTKAYFNAMYNNDTISAFDAAREGIDAQFTKEGAQTFIAGFTQGALLLGLFGAAFRKGVIDPVTDWSRAKYEKSTMSPDDFASLKAQRESEQATRSANAASFVDRLNKDWANPINPIKSTVQAAVRQNAYLNNQNTGLGQNDRKGYHDDKDDATRDFLHTMVKNGLADMWVKRLTEYANGFTPEELCKQMGVDQTPENYEAIKNEIEEMPGRLKDLKRIMKEVDSKMVNKFNPWAKDENGLRKYKEGTEEFETEYNNWELFEKSKDQIVMLKDITQRNLIRQNEILNGKNGSTGLMDMPFGKNLEFATIYTASSLEMLDAHIAVQDQILAASVNGDAQATATKTATEAYRTALKNYTDAYTKLLADGHQADAAKNKELNDAHMKPLTEALFKFLENEIQQRNVATGKKATEAKSGPTYTEVENAMEKMMDYYRLGIEQGSALRYLNMLLDPSIIKKYQASFILEGRRRQSEAGAGPGGKSALEKKLRTEEDTLIAKIMRIQSEGTLANKDLILKKWRGQLAAVHEKLKKAGFAPRVFDEFEELKKQQAGTAAGAGTGNKQPQGGTGTGTGTNVPATDDQKREVFLAGNNLKMKNRDSSGKVLGGQLGWKARININASSDADYKNKALKIITWLNNYFNTTSPDQYAEIGYVAYRKGLQASIWKHLSGGDKGEADFTVYIGSDDDLRKFAQDVENSEIKDIIKQGKTISKARSAGDVAVTDNVSARFEGVGQKAIFSYLAIFPKQLVSLLENAGFSEIIDAPIKIGKDEYKIDKDGIYIYTGPSSARVLNPLSDLPQLQAIRNYLFNLLYGKYYNNGVMFDSEWFNTADVRTEAELLKDKEALLNYYVTNYETSFEGIPQEISNGHGDLEDTLKVIDRTHNDGNVEEHKEARKEAIEKYFNELIDKITEDVTLTAYSNLKDNPRIEQTGTDGRSNPLYSIKVGKEELKSSDNAVIKYRSLTEARKALENYVNTEYPVIEGTDFRKGQIIYEKSSGKEYTVVGLDKDKDLVLNESKDGLSKKSKITIPVANIDQYVASKEMVDIKPQESNFDANQPKVTDPWATVNVAILKAGGAFSKETQTDIDRFNEEIRSIDHTANATGEGFSIRVTKNPERSEAEKKKYPDINPIEGNTQIFQKRQEYAIELLYNGRTIGYVTNPSSQYYVDPNGVTKTIATLTLDDIKALYAMKGDNPMSQFATAQEWKDHLQQTETDGLMLDTLIKEALKNGGELDLKNKVQFVPHYQFNFIKTGEIGAKLSEIEGLQSGPYGLKMYVYNNYTDDQRVIQSTMTPAEANYAKEIKPVGQQSYMTAVVVLENGKFVPIQLTPRQINPEEISTLLDEISNIDTEEKLKVANKALSKLFIAIRVYDEDQYQNKGVSIILNSVGKGDENHLYGRVIQRIGKEYINLGNFNIESPKGELFSVGNVDEFLAMLNKGITSDTVNLDISELTEDNLKWQPDVMNLGEMETSVHPDLFKSISLTYFVPDPKGNKRPYEVIPFISTVTPGAGGKEPSSTDLQKRKEDLDPDLKLIDQDLIDARNGNVEKQKKFEAYGIDWEQTTTYRFIGESELDALLSNKKIESKRFVDAGIDVTSSPIITTAADKDYRVTFKESFDKNNGLGKVIKKNEEDSNLQKGRGYDINDVQKIEQLDNDGNVTKVIYDAESTTGEPVSDIDAQRAEIEAKKAEIVNNAEANEDYEILNILYDQKKGANKHLDDRLTAIVKDRMGLSLTVREYLLKDFPRFEANDIDEVLAITFPELLQQIDSYKQSDGVNYARIDSLPIVYAARIISELGVKDIDVDGQTKLSDIVKYFTEPSILGKEEVGTTEEQIQAAIDEFVKGFDEVKEGNEYFYYLKAMEEKYGIDANSYDEWADHEEVKNHFIAQIKNSFEKVDKEEGNIDNIIEDNKPASPLSDDDAPFKLIAADTFDEHDIEDIDVFNAFMKENLPDWMTVGDLDEVTANMKTNRIVVGQFVMYIDDLGRVAGRIETKAKNPGKYHEAGHAIFRMLLPQKKINALIKEANQINPVTPEQLDEFRNSHQRYEKMSDEDLRDEYQEEFIMDEFDKYSMNRKKSKATSGMRAFFNRILDWIRWVWDKWLGGTRMRAMFYEAHTNRFKNARLQDNDFTHDNAFITAEPVPSIKIGKNTTKVKLSDGTTKEVVYDKYLPREKAAATISSMRAEVLLQMGEGKYTNYNQAIEATLKRWKDTFDYNSDINQLRIESIKNPSAREGYRKAILEMHNVFNETESRNQLRDAIVNELRINGIKNALEREAHEDDETELGSRNSDNRFINLASIGGYESIGRDLKMYIGSNHIKLTDIDKKNEFGMDTHADGTPMIETVDTNYVYSGLLKLMSGSSNADEVLNRVLAYMKTGNNPETIKFLQNAINETGFNVDKFKETGEIECSSIEGLNLFNRVMKGFMQIAYNYTNVVTDPSNGETFVMDASNEKAERNQFRQWSNDFYQKYWNKILQEKNNPARKAIYKESIQPFETFINQINTISAKKTMIPDEDNSAEGSIGIATLSRNISNGIYKNLGIYYHPDFIMYSIISGKEEAARTQEQQNFVSRFNKVKAIDIKKLRDFMDYLKENINPFVRPEGSTESTSAEKFLLSTAKNNALIDERINTTSHTNGKGDIIYDYGYRNFNSDAVDDLNNTATIERKLEDPEYSGAFLLTDPDFLYMDKVLSIAGSIGHKESFMSTEEDESGVEYKERKIKATESNKLATDFGETSGKEYGFYMIAQYDISKQPDAYIKRPDGSFFYAININLGPIAEKNTNHSVRLPIKKTIDKTADGWAVNEETKKLIFNIVKDEVERIKRIQAEIEEGKEVRIAAGKKWVKDYHDGKIGINGKIEKGFKGLKLWKTYSILNVKARPSDVDTVAEKIHELATNPNFKVEQEMSDIYKAIEISLQKEVSNFKEMLIEKNMMTKDGVNKMLPSFIFNGFDSIKNDATNIRKSDYNANIAQVYINSYINYLGIAHVLYGDEALRVKDFTDLWKRRAGVSGQGPSVNNLGAVAGTDIVPVTKVLHVTYPDDTDVDIEEVDNGQMLQTAKGTYSFLLGQGKMNDKKAKMLKKLEAGKPLSIDDQLEMLRTNGVFNPMKLMYDDAHTYLKCSSLTLLKEDTSYWSKSERKWLPLPGRELNHLKLEKATEQEDGFDPETGDYRNNIVLLHPVSVTKGMKDAITPSVEEIAPEYYRELDAKYLRLQVENPSGKSHGTEPVQPKYQILAGHNEHLDTPIYVKDKGMVKTQTVIDQYMEAVRQRKYNNAIMAIAEIFDTEHPITNINDLPADLVANMGKFMEKTRDTLLATGANAQTLEFYETDKLGNAKFDINLPPIMEKATQMLLSHFIKGITKEKVPLWSMTIMADSGFSVIRKVTHVDKDGQPIYSKCPIITMDEFKKDPERYNKTINRVKRNSQDKFENLQEIAEEEAQKGNALYIADVLRDIVPMLDDKGNVLFYYTEALRPFLTEDEIKNNKLSEVYDYVVGARIPGTNKHSYTVLKWVDRVSTSHGTSCVVSRRVMLRDGHDNDLDKFYIQIPDTYINEHGIRVPYGSAIDKTGMFVEYLSYQEANNKMLRAKVKKFYNEDTDLKECLNEISLKKKTQPELLQQVIDTNRLLSDSVEEGEMTTNKGIVQTDEIYTYGTKETGVKEGTKAYWSNVLLQHKNYNSLYKSAKKELLKLFKENSNDIAALSKKIESIKHLLFLRAMEELKLPANVDDFIKRGGVRLNNGVQTNRAISLQASLLSSEHISGGENAVIKEATTTDNIKDYANNLVNFLRTPVNGAVSKFAEKLATQIEDIGGDHNGMVAQITAYDMNKGGSKDVGAVANVIQAGSILNQFNKKVVNVLPYVFDGHVLNNYGRDKTISGATIGSQIDTLAQMDVDATKDHLPARFSLTTEFTGYLSNMMRLGQDLETALLYPLTPVWKEYAKRTEDSGKSFRVETPENANKVIFDIKNRLEKAGAKRTPLTKEVLMNYLREGKRNIDVELALIHDLEVMKILFEPMRAIAKVLTLDTGRSLTTLEQFEKINEAYGKLGIGMTEEEFKKSEISVDVRDVITHRHGVLAANYNIYNTVNTKLLPKFLLAKSPAYSNMHNMIMKNFEVPFNDPNFVKSISYNLVSALTIIPYMKWLRDNNMGEVLDTMNHNLIWDSADSNNSIVKIIKNGRDLLKGKNANPALNAFLNIVEKDAAKGVNINQVIVNSFTKLSEQLQTKIVESIKDLVANQNGDIHKLGLSLMNYLFVKDGGQFKYGSFIRFMPTFMFENWSGVITETVKSLSVLDRNDNEGYINNMGVTHNDLVENIINAMGTHISMVPYLKQYGKGNYDNYEVPDGLSEDVVKELERFGNKSVPTYVQPKTGNIIIDMFNGIRNWVDMGDRGYVYENAGTPYSDIEKEKMRKNLSYAEQAGFTRIKDNLEFPITIQKDGRVYLLKRVGKEEPDNFIGLLRPGQMIPTGVLATYVPIDPDGDKKQISVAKAIYGAYPYKTTGLPEGVLGEIQTNLIGDWVMAGTATTTIRTNSYHKLFYKGDGVYKMSNGQFADVKEIGIARKDGNEIVIDGNDGKIYRMTLDAFGKREGFGNWEGFVNGQRYSTEFVNGNETRHFYTIKPALKLPESIYKRSDAISVPETDVTRELFQDYKINTVQVGTQIMFFKNGELWKTANQLKIQGITTRRALLDALKNGSLDTISQPTQASVTNPKLLKNENGLIIAENVIPKNETIKIAEEAKGFIQETSFKQTAGSVSWGYGLQWMRINAMTPKQREGLVIGKQLNGYSITQAMKDNFIKTGDSKGFPLYGYTNIDANGKELPKIPQNIVNYLASMGIDVSQYDASYNSVYDKSDSGSLIIHQDNTETNKSPIITISLGRPMKFVTYELNNANDFNVADSNNTAFRIAVNAVSGEALKLNIIPQSELDKNGKIKYGHLTPDTLLKYAEQIDKIQKTQLKQFVIDKLKEQFKNSEKTEYNLTNGAVLVFSGANRNVLHEIVFDPETNKKPMESGFPTLTVNKAFKGLGQGDKMVNTNDYRMVLTLRKVTGPTLENVVNEQKLVQGLSQSTKAPVSETNVSLPSIEQIRTSAIADVKEGEEEEVEIRDQRFDKNKYPLLSSTGMTDVEYEVIAKDPQKWEDAYDHGTDLDIDFYDENFLEDLETVANAIENGKISDKDILDIYSKDKGTKAEFLDKAKRMLEKAERTKTLFINKQLDLDLTENFEIENDVKKEELKPEDEELSDYVNASGNRLEFLPVAHETWKKQMLDYIKNCL